MKQTTVIISDLHLGGGKADPGDDHVYQNGELATFIGSLTSSELGQSGEIELYINGDFLEFAQTLQEAYASPSIRLWCSEAESLRKLNAILAGHEDIFEALGVFICTGNTVTIAAGNHDVDLYWPAVRERLSVAIGRPVAFEYGEEWTSRYGGKLQIAHGHIKDPANTFRNWANPFGEDELGVKRLEMCTGTLFMVKFVNRLEHQYPFADNIHPVQRLARLLIEDRNSGLFAVSWALLKFAAQHPQALQQKYEDYGSWIRARLTKNQKVAQQIVDAIGEAGAAEFPTVAQLRSALRTEEDVAAFLLHYWPELEASNAVSLFDPGAKATLGHGEPDKTLGTIKAAGDFGKDALRREAKARMARVPDAQVIVMGHTHVPDEWAITARCVYFNPGSWTRYVDLDRHPGLRLADLSDESRFPFSLRYVRVDVRDGQSLSASLQTFRAQPAAFD